MIFIHALLTGGGGISFFPTNSRQVFTIPCLFIFLRTLLHFFALTTNSTRLLSRVSALCVQKHRGVGYPFRLNPTEKPHRKFVVQVVGLRNQVASRTLNPIAMRALHFFGVNR